MFSFALVPAVDSTASSRALFTETEYWTAIYQAPEMKNPA